MGEDRNAAAGTAKTTMTTYWILGFWVSVGLLAYVCGGYSIVLVLASRIFRRRITRGARPRITLIIPTHNEEPVLQEKIENALSLEYEPSLLEIIVASDGSSDRTVEIARGFEGQGVRVLAFDHRRGKASVLNDAVSQATGDVLCLCDANVMFLPDALLRLVDRMADPRVGAVTGDVRIASHESNFAHGETTYYLMERHMQLAESTVGSLMGVDGGMYVVRKELFRPLPADTILDDFVITMQVINQGYRVVYEPSAVAHENGTPGARQEWRRRVRVSAGAAQCLSRRIWPPIWKPVELWQFISHKALRWFSPLFLLGMLIANVALILIPASPFYWFTLVAQLALYLVAGVSVCSLRLRESRLGGVIFYFVMSNVATAVGLIKGICRLQPVTWVQADRTHGLTR